MALRTGVLGPSEPHRTVPLAAGAVLLALVVAASTARAGWVSGAGLLPVPAVLGALAGAAVGVSPARGRLALGVTIAPAPFAAFLAVRSQVAWPGAPVGWATLAHGARQVLDGQPPDPLLVLFLLHLLFWLLGAWLAWGTLRLGQPLLAAAPAGAALAANVLNFPDGQDPYVFWFVALTLALLLFSTYNARLAAARREGIELAGNARWDYWERGVVAAAALVALGVLAPPLSASDRTLDIENGLSDGWGRITHGSRPGTLNSVGFASEVQLGGALAQLSGAVVFDYLVDGDAAGPSYFRGLGLQPGREEWGFVTAAASTAEVPMGHEVPLAETYYAEQRATYAIDMQRPPAAAPNLVVAPGQIMSADRAIEVMQSRPALRPSRTVLHSIDRATAGSGRGAYRVQVEQSVATEENLRADVAAYPEWVGAYRSLPPGYRAADVERRIHDLAVRVTAGAGNPYDRAAAIEQYLRSNYTYTVTPGLPLTGVDQEDWFLFSSRAGYCQYFATAMADMLRSLGVPVRLVNGYGPGTYDDRQHRFVVRESDAHTWPEVFFPSYGWIPFEPTPDGVYGPIQRGAGSGVTCSGGGCQSDSGASLATPEPAPTPRPRQEPAAPPVTAGPRGPGLPALRTWTPVGALALLGLALLAVMASRFLRPQTVAGVWRRATLLLQLAGVPPSAGETPIEFGDRVAGAFPEAAAGIRRLAGDYAVAVYAPPRLAEGRRAAILAGWAALRPLLLRRVAGRLRRRIP